MSAGSSSQAGRTVGVEEELLLVDPGSGEAVNAAGAVLHQHHTGRGRSAPTTAEDLEGELLRHMLETHTDPTADLNEIERQLRQARRTAVAVAEQAGAAVAAVGMAPLGSSAPGVSANPRYERIVNEFGDVGRRAGTLAMHVHVQIADDEEGVRVVDGLRPWLPLLTALAANSPYDGGHDTGYASYRHQVWSRWPTAGTSEPFKTVAEYRRVSQALISLGAALDTGMLYYDARLAESYPTVEVRVADTCTELEDGLVVVALTRALVSTLATEPAEAPGGMEQRSPVRSDLLRAAGWRAARYGLAADLVHPISWELVPARQAIGALVEHVAEALGRTGDTSRVEEGLLRLFSAGTGALRQRATFERTGTLQHVVADLVSRTQVSIE
jgi:carboxylate-amine ligase